MEEAEREFAEHHDEERDATMTPEEQARFNNRIRMPAELCGRVNSPARFHAAAAAFYEKTGDAKNAQRAKALAEKAEETTMHAISRGYCTICKTWGDGSRPCVNCFPHLQNPPRCECGVTIASGETLCPECERAEIHSMQVDAMHRDNDLEAIGQIPVRWVNAE